jgi:aminoglycoside phosphotransferase (APT) family kinase protein
MTRGLSGDLDRVPPGCCDAVQVAMHARQLDVTSAEVRALINEQFPRWRDLPVQPVPLQGTVNALFRLGTHLVARFPLVPADVDIARAELEAEAHAARELLGRTRFPTPEPVALGEPGPGYPMPWSVQTWLPGTVATPDNSACSVAFAHDLAEFIQGVRAIPTLGRAFLGSGRGGCLPDHDAWVATCLDRSQSLLDVEPLRQLWGRLRTLPPSPGGEVMTHGDLIPGNVLVADGRLAGVIDVGGLGPADPALDLVPAWHLLDVGPRQALRADLNSSDVEWARGAAWALQQALGAIWYYVDSNPAMSLMGKRTLERLVTQPPPIP